MIFMDVNDTLVRRVLVDTDSSVNVMYHDVSVKLELSEDYLKLIKTPLTGFTGDTIATERLITLPVELGTKLKIKRTTMDFVVIKLTCAHNIILG